MAEETSADDGLFPPTVGERLRDAREAAGLDLAEIAARTRIPQRQLDAIEAGRFDVLPAATYTVGFVRSYARALGLDEREMVAQFRAELAVEGPERAEYHPFEPADPARVPPRWLAWTALIVGLVLVVGYWMWRDRALDPGPPPQAVATDSGGGLPVPVAPLASPPSTAPASGEIVLTATDTVWLQVKDGDRRLIEKELAAGERFVVPAAARDPRLLTGRPQALRVTVGGREIAPLGTADQTVKDVPLTAAALVARPASSAPTPLPAAPQRP